MRVAVLGAGVIGVFQLTFVRHVGYRGGLVAQIENEADESEAVVFSAEDDAVRLVGAGLLLDAAGGRGIFCFHDDNFIFPSEKLSIKRVRAIREALEQMLGR